MKVTKEINKAGQISYRCSCCGNEYENLPLTFGTEYPAYYYTVPEEERESRVEKTESLCVIDEEHFFVRGRLTIPIIDHEEDFIFNVWTTLSEENFIRTNELWNDVDRVNELPYFGWLQTYVPTYGDTLNLKTNVITQEVGVIPKIEVIEENNQLAVDQKNGITLNRALEIAIGIIPDMHQDENEK